LLNIHKPEIRNFTSFIEWFKKKELSAILHIAENSLKSREKTFL
jgi:hypothetical protein